MERVNYKTNDLRFLILEGEITKSPLNIEQMQKYFNSQSKIIKIHQYQSALELLRSNNFDVILIDISSFSNNKFTGEELLQQLCKLTGKAIIIAISDEKSISLAISAMSSGAHAHIAKPLEFNELVALVNNLTYQYCKLEHKEKSNIISSEMIGFSNNAQPLDRKINIGSNNITNIKPMWQQEQRIIEDTILFFNGNVSRAAQALEISPSTIYRKRQCWEELSLS